MDLLRLVDSLSIEGVDMLMENDLAGGKVTITSHMTSIPMSAESTETVDDNLNDMFPSCITARVQKKKSAIQMIFFYLSETFLGNLNDDDESAEADISVATSQDTNINEIPEESSDTFTGVTGHVINRSRLISAQKGDPALARLNKRAINENEALS